MPNAAPASFAGPVSGFVFVAFIIELYGKLFDFIGSGRGLRGGSGRRGR